MASKFLLLTFYQPLGIQTSRPTAENLTAEISKTSILCQDRKVGVLPLQKKYIDALKNHTINLKLWISLLFSRLGFYWVGLGAGQSLPSPGSGRESLPELPWALRLASRLKLMAVVFNCLNWPFMCVLMSLYAIHLWAQHPHPVGLLVHELRKLRLASAGWSSQALLFGFAPVHCNSWQTPAGASGPMNLHFLE